MDPSEGLAQKNNGTTEVSRVCAHLANCPHCLCTKDKFSGVMWKGFVSVYRKFLRIIGILGWKEPHKVIYSNSLLKAKARLTNSSQPSACPACS